MKGRIRLPLILVVLGLAGVGMIVGGVTVLHRATTGPITHVKVAECHYTGTGRTAVCTGAFVTGGALVGGNGHIVIGTIEGASWDDVGHDLEVRVHGGTAYVPSLRLPIILLVLGVFIAGTLFYAAWNAFTTSAPRKEPGIAGLPTG
jgi:uncharacterized integral membrane protein